MGKIAGEGSIEMGSALDDPAMVFAAYATRWIMPHLKRNFNWPDETFCAGSFRHDNDKQGFWIPYQVRDDKRKRDDKRDGKIEG